MNRPVFFSVYLTVLGLLPWAPRPCSTTPPDSLLPTAHTHAYAPTTNEPFFPGGQPALDAYLKTIAAYPPQARASGIEGTVRVRFRVLPTGRLTEIQLVKRQGPLLDSAAVQIVLLMPRWYPAHQAGVAVACLVELAIVFRFD